MDRLDTALAKIPQNSLKTLAIWSGIHQHDNQSAYTLGKIKGYVASLVDFEIIEEIETSYVVEYFTTADRRKEWFR
jgi:hypothetical protein